MVNTSISSLLRDCAIRMPDAPAILAPGRMPLSFAGVWEQTQAMARALRSMGISNSTRVAIVLPNGPEMATAFLGTAACAASAPLNPGYQASEFRFYLEDTRAEAVLLRKAEDGAIRNVARDMGLLVVELESGAADAAGHFRIAGHRTDGAATATFSADDDVALILHTSGTTARPKSVPLTHANLMASAQGIARHLALTPVDRCLNVMPLFHIHGLVGALLATVAGGGSIVCAPGFTEADFFDWVAEFRPSWYTAVPTIHQAIAAGAARYQERATGHRFRFVRSSSAALPPATLRLLEEVLLAPVIEAYGMTEASHQMASNPLPPGQRKPGSVGLAAGADIAVMDDSSHLLEAGRIGEIVIRGPGVTPGYENNPQANAGAFVDGWFRTGDQGHLDERGYLHISGRLKEIVNRGGEKISPREIDDGLLELNPVQRLDHVSAGLTYEDPQGWSVDAAMYCRLSGSPVQRFENVYNRWVLLPELHADRVLFKPSRSRACGIDTSLRWTVGDHLLLRAQYTLARTEELIDGDWQPRPWDARHQARASLQWQDARWNLSLAAAWHSGWPTSDLQTRTDPDRFGPDRFGKARFNGFFSLDFHAGRFFAVGASTLETYLDVSNATARENEGGTIYFSAPDGIESRRRHLLPIIPNLGLRLQW